MLKRLLLVVAFILPLTVLGNTEAGGRWSLYIRNFESGSLLRIYEDGEIEELDLGLEDGQFTMTKIAIYPNQSLAAFCTVIPNGAELPIVAFYVRDLQANTERINIPVESGECNVSAHSFSTDGSAVAYGTLRSQNDWTLSVLDTSTGEVLHELNELPVEDVHSYAMPVPLFFPGNTLTFAMIPWGTEGRPENDAFVWNLETGDIERDNTFGNFQSDFLPSTGELVWLDLNEDRPATLPTGPMPTSNVVRLRDSNGEINDIYYNGDELITDVRFIDNGQALAIALQSRGESGDPGDLVKRWVHLDRRGEASEIAVIEEGYIDVIPFHTGYALFIWSPTDGSSLHTVIDGETTQLWAPEGTGQWGILSSDVNFTTMDVDPFPPIN